jgi:hypothetical protein
MGHHQVLLLKLSHFNFYVICSLSAYLFVCVMPRLTLFPFSTSPFLISTILKILKLYVHYKIFLKTPVVPLGCHPLIQFCSMSFVPPGSSFCFICIMLCYECMVCSLLYFYHIVSTCKERNTVRKTTSQTQ